MAAAASSSLASDGSTDAVKSYLLPYVTLQPTYAQVYAEILDGKLPAENVWLSLYSENAPMKSIHATLTLTAKEKDDVNIPDEVKWEVTKGGRGLILSECDRKPVTSGDMSNSNHRTIPDLIISTSSSSLNATSPTTSQNSPYLPSQVRLRHPIHTIPTIIKGRRSERALEHGGGGQISAFDVSPDGMRIVVGGEDGECVVAGLPGFIRGQQEDARQEETGSDEQRSIEEKAQRRLKLLETKRLAALRLPLTGHVGDVQAASFFPSSQVLLTASSDLTLRLYSAQDAICPRILKGHKRAVTSIAIIGRGKRVVSAGLDGTIRVWDVKQAKSIRTIGCRGWSGVECLKLLKVTGGESAEEEEDGLGDHLLFAGLSSGYVQTFLLRISSDVHSSSHDDIEEDGQDASRIGVSVIDWPVLEIPPESWPSLPDGCGPPGASDFWKVESTTGAVWSLDAMVSGQPDQSKGGISNVKLITGSKTGIVRLFQVDTNIPPSSPAEGEATAAPLSVKYRELLNLKRNSASVHSLRFISADTTTSSPESVPDAVVATADGTPFRLSFSSTATTLEPVVKEEYTGWEAGEPVEGIGILKAGEKEERIFLAGAEGAVRIY